LSCKQCLSVVQGTSTKIYKRTQYHHTTVHTQYMKLAVVLIVTKQNLIRIN